MNTRTVDESIAPRTAKPARARLRPGTYIAQQVLGLLCYVFIVLPYVRRVRGRFPRGGYRLYVCNHVSLLDTLVLGGLFWSRQLVPILVLGDKRTWHKNWLRRLLAGRVGYLIERGRITKETAEKLGDFARQGGLHNLVVFPEGTRGDGVAVKPCQPGIDLVAREAGLPLVPIFLENLQRVSTKMGPLHLIGGLRKVTVHVGREFDPSGLDREELLTRVRHEIAAARAD